MFAIRTAVSTVSLIAPDLPFSGITGITSGRWCPKPVRAPIARNARALTSYFSPMSKRIAVLTPSVFVISSTFTYRRHSKASRSWCRFLRRGIRARALPWGGTTTWNSKSRKPRPTGFLLRGKHLADLVGIFGRHTFSTSGLKPTTTVASSPTTISKKRGVDETRSTHYGRAWNICGPQRVA